MHKISVIVPVYKVEPYLHRCVDSILAQTFPDFELILVDDGSPDNCGSICDEYAKADSRILVIHQKNGGLSAARNAGIDWVFAHSDSQWFAFIDSDDWVHPRYLELLYRAAVENSVRISQCMYIETDGTAPVPSVASKTHCITPEEQFLHWYMAFAWGKLYARACFDSIRYPVGKLYEDVAIWYKLLFAEKKIGLVEEVLYYYFINREGIVRSAWKPAKLAQVDAWEAQLPFIRDHCSAAVLDEALKKNCWVLKNQYWEIQDSNSIPPAERDRYSALVLEKLRNLLRQYEPQLRRTGIYDAYAEVAFPRKSRLRSLLRRTLHSPKKLLSACKSSALQKLTKPVILFESIPDFSDNTRAVYDEMLRRGLDKRYYLIWDDQDHKPVFLRPDETVKSILDETRGLPKRLYLWSLSHRMAAIVCCNRTRFSVDPEKPLVFYLSHGTPMKSLHAYYTIPEYVDFALAASESVIPICAFEFNIDKKKFFAAGFPRNDVFAQPTRDIRAMLHTDCSRIIVWYPTYRQHINGSKTGSSNALPIIYNVEAAKQLDHAAREVNTLIVLKPHFIQDVSLIHDLRLNNLRLIDDSFFRENGITSYQFVHSCDALITDYSSIYFDYTLADKPIAVTWDDLEEYRSNPGFAVDLNDYMKGAVKVYCVEDLISFVRDVAARKDLLQAERREIRDRVNTSVDGKNAERVVDYILDKLSET